MDGNPPDVEEDPLAWARDHMPIHRSLAAAYGDETPFDGWTVGVASHLEHNTGVLIETLHRAGAEVLFAPSEPGSTKAEVVTHLDSIDGITAYAEAGMSDEAFAAAQHDLLSEAPDLLLDDGAEVTQSVMLTTRCFESCYSFRFNCGRRINRIRMEILPTGSSQSLGG